MQAVRPLMKAGSALQSAASIQTRQMSAISSKPMVRIPFAEKLAHGIIMTVAYSVIPVWVLVNIRSYRGMDK